MRKSIVVAIDRGERFNIPVTEIAEELHLEDDVAEKVYQALNAYYTPTRIIDECGTFDGFVKEVTLVITSDGVTVEA